MTPPLPLPPPRYEFSSETDSEPPKQTAPELHAQITKRRHSAHPLLEEANTGLTAQKPAKANTLNISSKGKEVATPPSAAEKEEQQQQLAQKQGQQRRTARDKEQPEILDQDQETQGDERDGGGGEGGKGGGGGGSSASGGSRGGKDRGRGSKRQEAATPPSAAKSMNSEHSVVLPKPEGSRATGYSVTRTCLECGATFASALQLRTHQQKCAPKAPDIAAMQTACRRY
jgi:hypothetical protein